MKKAKVSKDMSNRYHFDMMLADMFQKAPTDAVADQDTYIKYLAKLTQVPSSVIPWSLKNQILRGVEQNLARGELTNITHFEPTLMQIAKDNLNSHQWATMNTLSQARYGQVTSAQAVSKEEREKRVAQSRDRFMRAVEGQGRGRGRGRGDGGNGGPRPPGILDPDGFLDLIRPDDRARRPRGRGRGREDRDRRREDIEDYISEFTLSDQGTFLNPDAERQGPIDANPVPRGRGDIAEWMTEDGGSEDLYGPTHQGPGIPNTPSQRGSDQSFLMPEAPDYRLPPRARSEHSTIRPTRIRPAGPRRRSGDPLPQPSLPPTAAPGRRASYATPPASSSRKSSSSRSSSRASFHSAPGHGMAFPSLPAPADDGIYPTVPTPENQNLYPGLSQLDDGDTPFDTSGPPPPYSTGSGRTVPNADQLPTYDDSELAHVSTSRINQRRQPAPSQEETGANARRRMPPIAMEDELIGIVLEIQQLVDAGINERKLNPDICRRIALINSYMPDITYTLAKTTLPDMSDETQFNQMKEWLRRLEQACDQQMTDSALQDDQTPQSGPSTPPRPATPPRDPVHHRAENMPAARRPLTRAASRARQGVLAPNRRRRSRSPPTGVRTEAGHMPYPRDGIINSWSRQPRRVWNTFLLGHDRLPYDIGTTVQGVPWVRIPGGQGRQGRMVHLHEEDFNAAITGDLEATENAKYVLQMISVLLEPIHRGGPARLSAAFTRGREGRGVKSKNRKVHLKLDSEHMHKLLQMKGLKDCTTVACMRKQLAVQGIPIAALM